MTIAAKGQVTLRQAMLDHMDLRPGDKVVVSLLRDGRVELASTEGERRLRGRLRRPEWAPVLLEAMQQAVEAGRMR